MDKCFKVLMLNGSPRQNGNIAVGFREMQKIFDELNVEYECIDLGKKDVRGCIACGTCGNTGKCVFNDVVTEISDKFEKADGIVVGSPVYYGCANGTLVSALQRVFYSSHFDKRMKVGASVVCARRSGCTATVDELNKFFTISNMAVAPSQYWNNIHGGAPGEADQDEEGKQTMRALARNMVFLMESIALGKEKLGLPKQEEHLWTNFIG